MERVWTCAEEGQEYIGRRILNMELQGRRQRGENQKGVSWMRRKEDMQIAGVREEDAEDRQRWRTMIHCGDSLKSYLKPNEKVSVIPG